MCRLPENGQGGAEEQRMLKYNIDFEIMGLILTVIIWIYFRMNYVAKTRSDRAFLRVCVCVFSAQVADIATAFTFSMGRSIPPVVNLLLNTAYFLCALASAVAFERYVASYVFEKNQRTAYEYVRLTPVVLLIGLLLVNLFTFWLFRFDAATGDYIHGPLYYGLYLLLLLIVINALYLVLRYRRSFDVKQRVSGIVFIVLIVSGMLLQALVLPDVYLSFGLVPLSLLMVMFSLETPDYRKLTRTMAELEAAKEEANRASRVKSDFLANMSHEIRTPINVILGFDQMILRESREADTLAYAGNIMSSGRVLLSLVNDILDLSKIEAGKMELVPAEYDTARLLGELVRELTPRAEAKDLYVKCQVDGRLPRRLVGDDVRIRQILTNLLTNAVKYTETGGVTFTVRVNDGAAAVAGEISLSFSVRDTGYGIREEDREKLFRAFERVDGQRTRAIEGTGLGLSITVRCLELMGSRLELDSEYGKGSDFHFTLVQGVADPAPIGSFEAAAAAAPAEVFREDFTAPEARVLVVDDVALNLKVFTGLLKRSEIRIDTASSGEAALDRMRDAAYDCVFMDHQMPDMDGLEALSRIRSESGLHQTDVPVIVLTANAITGAKEMYLSHGFSDYLTKPIDGRALSAMLRKWLPQDKIRERAPEAPLPPPAPEAEPVLEFRPGERDGAGPHSEQVLRRLEAGGLNVPGGLRYAMGDPALYLELVGDFAADYPEKAQALRSSCERKDWNSYSITAHALKSAAKTVGADAISAQAAELERAAVSDDAALIGKKHAPFIAAYGQLAATVADALGRR